MTPIRLKDHRPITVYNTPFEDRIRDDGWFTQSIKEENNRCCNFGAMWFGYAALIGCIGLSLGPEANFPTFVFVGGMSTLAYQHLMKSEP